MTRRTLSILVVCTGIVISTISCATKTPTQTTLMQKTDLTISAATLRIQVRSLADRYSGLMEKAGEAVLAEEDDPRMRRHALMWLTNGIPAMQQALFRIQSDFDIVTGNPRAQGAFK